MQSIVKNTGRPSENIEGIDIDVTPIMNMFIILIPFLVSMAVFAHLSILPFTLPPAAGAGSGPKTDDLKVTVAMTPDGYAVTLGEALLDSLPLVDDAYDYVGLTAALTERREGLKFKDEVVLAVDDGIKFDDVVASMDHCRDAGFTKIGLAAGTNAGRDVTVE